MAASLFAAFDSQPTARPMGMGGAFTALANDLNAPLYNPAGLVQSRKIGVLVSYDQKYAGIGQNLSHSYLAGGYSMEQLSFGMGINFDSYAIYQEVMLTGTVAYSIDKYQILNVGANIKGLNRKFTLSEEFSSDPIFADKTSKWNLSVDAGILFKPNDTISIGAAMLDIIEPNIAFGEGVTEKLPFTINGGILVSLKNFRIAADVLYRNKDLNQKTYINEKVGVEYLFLKEKYAARAGYDIKLNSASAGASARFGMLNVDYGFVYQMSGPSDNYGSHIISLSMNFGIKTGIPGYITGQIFSAESSKPLPQTTIKAYQDGKLISKTVSDENGNYRLMNLMEGKYDVEAEAKGYAPRTMEYKSVYAQEETGNVNFRLYDSPGMITGKVTEMDTKTGVGQALVEVRKGDSIVGRGMSKDDGTYEVINLPPGQYNVIASAKRHAKLEVQNIYVNKGDVLSDISFALPEAEMPKVAVLPFKNSTAAAQRDDYGAAVADMITTAIVKSKKLNVIERENLQKILKEQELWLSGMVDAGTTKKIGQITGVSFIITGSVSKLGTFIELDVRMLDTETGKIVVTENDKANSEEQLRSAIERLVVKLVKNY
ncbi:MAG: carboxypeptidase regulatory-like domain-containing protein [bacterium]|nr:carboxypeptidase regulatory-like domain-containing protein [bacterium]